MATKYVALSLRLKSKNHNSSLIDHRVTGTVEQLPRLVQELFEADEKVDTVRVFAVTDQPATSVPSSVKIDDLNLNLIIIPVQTGLDVEALAKQVVVELHCNL